MTEQFVAGVVATFTIIFLLGCFCMSWQIFIGYRTLFGMLIIVRIKHLVTRSLGAECARPAPDRGPFFL